MLAQHFVYRYNYLIRPFFKELFPFTAYDISLQGLSSQLLLYLKWELLKTLHIQIVNHHMEIRPWTFLEGVIALFDI